jgi:AraC-like DNA-binding protein
VASNAGSTVRVHEQAARPALQPFVQRFLVVEFPAFYRDAHLPDIRPVAAFSLRGAVRIDEDGGWAPPAAFSGPRTTLRTHEHCHGHAVLLATFTPVGASAFLDPSLEEFSGMTTDLAGLLARRGEVESLGDRLAGARNHQRRIELLEEFLLAHLRRPEPDPLVAAAVAWIERGTGNGRIAELTRYIGLSQSALERRFRRVLGVSPKTFASVSRLDRAVRLRAAGADFTSAAHAAGYFDQSHFVHAFRRATGSAPHEFFRRVPTW